MSVSQVKKRFEDMEGYLCRDKEGLRRLKLLKDDVNVLRTSLAAAVSAKEDAEAIKDAARERADKAESECKEAKLEVERLAAENESLRFRLAEATKPEKNPTDKGDPDRLMKIGDHVECKKMLKELRRVLPRCPRLKHLGKSPVFVRQEIAEGYSHQAIWTLGAAVAIIAAHEGRVTISDPAGVLFEKEDDEKAEGLGVNFMRWYGKNYDYNKVMDKPLKFGNVKVPTLQPDSSGDAERTAAFLDGE